MYNIVFIYMSIIYMIYIIYIIYIIYNVHYIIIKDILLR